MSSTATTSKLAHSASALGAALLGFGIGAKWGSAINANIPIIIITAGAFIHIAGMYVAQLKTAGSGLLAKILWITAWICLVALAGLFVYMALA